MNTQRLLITPIQAANMLTLNLQNNRPINERVVAKYANEIKNGNWVTDNGESIKFDKNGMMVDGQHRLSAIIKSNVSVNMWVTYGVDSRAFMTIDVGASRSIGAILSISGVACANQKTGIIRSLIRYRNHSTSEKYAPPTATDVMAFYDKETDLIDFVNSQAAQLTSKSAIRIPASVVGGMIAFLYDRHPSVLDFFGEVMSGRDITNNAVYLLRDRIITSATNSKMTMPIAAKEQLILKAFTHYKNKYQAKTLKVSTEESVSNLFKQAIQ
jgi:hypothetical protein